MNIALIGYGKMGKAIEEIAIEQGHSITLKINSGNLHDFVLPNFKDVDVAIEFTSPHTAYSNIVKCFEFGVPVVCGSTGWLDKWNNIEELCKQHNGALLYASNFSVGVNIFFELNAYLAKLMAKQSQYEVGVTEIHHTQKKDAPSGTAITIAEQIIELQPQKNTWVNTTDATANQISIISKREDPAPGTHIVKYTSVIDDIEIIHTAHNRKGFAAGAVLAAEFLNGKTGIFSMKDVLEL